MKPLQNLLCGSSALSCSFGFAQDRLCSTLAYLLDMSRGSLLPAKRSTSEPFTAFRAGCVQRSGQYARLRGRTYEAPLCAAHFAQLRRPRAGSGHPRSGVRPAASREHCGFKARSLLAACGVASTLKRGSLLRPPAALVTVLQRFQFSQPQV